MNIIKPHISLNVTNIDASVAFYERAFGIPATKRRPGYAKFDLREPALNLTMQEAPRTGINASHFGVQVVDHADVDAAKKRFEAAGLQTFSEENVTCCYAVQDKVWVHDPDGNAWEIFVVTGDAATMGRSDAPFARGESTEAKPTLGAESTESTACCSPTCCVPTDASDVAR